MIPNGIYKKITGIAALNAGAAALNLATTVLIVRWLGAGEYANYMIDLAVVSLMLLLLEIIPSNFSVFRLQDDEKWRKVVGWHLTLTAAILAGLAFGLGNRTEIFQEFTPWIALFAFTQATKRYLDLTLQSSGQLQEFMKIEVFTSILRIILFIIGIALGFSGADVIWGSLAISFALIQILWASKRPRESYAKKTPETLATESTKEIVRIFLPYYPGIILKRIKDNLLPLVSNEILGSKEAVGVFMLSYRGLAFAIGQLRTIEAMLYHRETKEIIDNARNRAKSIIPLLMQIVAITASTFMVWVAGESNHSFWLTVALSFLAWPIAFSSLERANALSKFKANPINWGLFAYICVVFAGAQIALLNELQNPYWLVAVFVTAESIQYITVRLKREK